MGGVVTRMRRRLGRCPRDGICLSAPPIVPNLNDSKNFRVRLRTHKRTAFSGLIRTTSALVCCTSGDGRLTNLSSSLRSRVPRLCFSMSHSGIGVLNIPLTSIFSAVGTCANSMCMGSFGVFGHVCGICVRTRTPCHRRGSGVGLFFIGTSGNTVMPLASLKGTSCAAKPNDVGHFGVFAATIVHKRTTRKCDSKRTVRVVRRVTHSRLPSGVKLR